MTAKPFSCFLNPLLLGASLFIPLGLSFSMLVRAMEAAGSAASPSQSDSLVTIESDVQKADNQTGIVTASGNVRITYPDRGMVATSKQAQYYSKEGRLILSGDVDVIDSDGQQIRAERLVYQLDQERLLAQPAKGKQVVSKLKLNPPTSGKEPGLPVP